MRYAPASTPAPRSRRPPAPVPAAPPPRRRPARGSGASRQTAVVVCAVPRKGRAGVFGEAKARRDVHTAPWTIRTCLKLFRSMPPDPSSSPLRRTVAFAGRLASMKREEAFALVRQHGGTPRRGLTKTTGILVVGELGWPLLPDGQPSKSLALAKS